MRLSELAIAAVITAGVAGASYSAVDVQGQTRAAEAVAQRADCRAVDEAILAFYAEQGRVPQQVRDIASYIRGDVSAYRISDGRAVGPGCPPRTPR
ncbi:hypothetical protein [Krasilnikovia sp. MM14-A1259]|uniref:hypothetical protein n=1 Tax=Krasilnikovia sp. MM14-A1259 TaxID=3373539 RepID=UPI00399D304D